MPAQKKKKSTGPDEALFDFGKTAIGGLFKGLSELVDLASKAAEKGQAISREGEIKGLGKDVKGVYGFSVRTLAGKPVVEHFGNIKETPEGPVVEEAREPLVDIFDEGDHLIVIAEVPGVEKEDIKVELKDDLLSIRADGKERKYRKDIELSP